MENFEVECPDCRNGNWLLWSVSVFWIKEQQSNSKNKIFESSKISLQKKINYICKNSNNKTSSKQKRKHSKNINKPDYDTVLVTVLEPWIEKNSTVNCVTGRYRIIQGKLLSFLTADDKLDFVMSFYCHSVSGIIFWSNEIGEDFVFIFGPVCFLLLKYAIYKTYLNLLFFPFS